MDLFEDHEPVVDGPIVIVGSSQWSLFGEVGTELLEIRGSSGALRNLRS